jgi:Spy/CpxP family protein refolding chaperone
MKKSVFIAVIVLLFVINITALTTFSYNRWLRPKQASSQALQSTSWQTFKEQVSLSPQQSKTMQNLRLSFQQEVESLRQRLWEKRNALVEEARDPSPDLKRIDLLIEEIGALQTEIQKKGIRGLLRDKRLLNPRQQEKYFSLFEEFTQVRGRGYRMRGMGRRGRRWLRENQK